MDLGLRDRVVLVASADADERRCTTAALEAEGARVATVDSLAASAAEAQRVAGELGRLDGVVMCLPQSPSRQVLAAGVEELYDSWTAVEAVAATFRAALPTMTARGWGRLVSVMSGSVKWLADDSDELATLAGLGVLGLHKSAVADVARSGVAVNAVLRSIDSDPVDVAAVTTFLLSEPAGYLHGVTIGLDGARSSSVF